MSNAIVGGEQMPFQQRAARWVTTDSHFWICRLKEQRCGRQLYSSNCSNNSFFLFSCTKHFCWRLIDSSVQLMNSMAGILSSTIHFLSTSWVNTCLGKLCTRSTCTNHAISRIRTADTCSFDGFYFRSWVQILKRSVMPLGSEILPKLAV